MNIQPKRFEQWLIKDKGISQISAQKYSRAIVTVFKWADKEIENISFQAPEEFDQLRSSDLENTKFISNNERGHRMYSVALNHFRDYLFALK